jgi:uncharacterized membrane protein
MKLSKKVGLTATAIVLVGVPISVILLFLNAPMKAAATFALSLACFGLIQILPEESP